MEQLVRTVLLITLVIHNALKMEKNMSLSVLTLLPKEA